MSDEVKVLRTTVTLQRGDDIVRVDTDTIFDLAVKPALYEIADKATYAIAGEMLIGKGALATSLRNKGVR